MNSPGVSNAAFPESGLRRGRSRRVAATPRRGHARPGRSAERGKLRTRTSAGAGRTRGGAAALLGRRERGRRPRKPGPGCRGRAASARAPRCRGSGGAPDGGSAGPRGAAPGGEGRLLLPEGGLRRAAQGTRGRRTRGAAAAAASLHASASPCSVPDCWTSGRVVPLGSFGNAPVLPVELLWSRRRHIQRGIWRATGSKNPCYLLLQPLNRKWK